MERRKYRDVAVRMGHNGQDKRRPADVAVGKIGISLFFRAMPALGGEP